jgi:hypothetical protein
VRMDTHNMEYNSEKDLLILPEYGRNIQMMVQFVKTIEDKAERQAYAEKVIGLMNQMNPQNRSNEDQQAKLWKHLFQIADFDIDIDPPEGLDVSKETAMKKPEHVGYPTTDTNYRHYGHNIQELIKRAVEMPDGLKRKGFIEVIGAYMKLAYRTWNKDHFVSDDNIKSDLKALSKGKLELDSHISLDHLTHPSAPSKKKKKNSPNSINSNAHMGNHNPSGGKYKKKYKKHK